MEEKVLGWVEEKVLGMGGGEGTRYGWVEEKVLGMGGGDCGRDGGRRWCKGGGAAVQEKEGGGGRGERGRGR